MSSNAVGSSVQSAVVGYKITKGDFRNETPNLPQRVALLGEANFANQGTLSLAAKEITTSQQAGELYGFGSPIHMAMRILRPASGGGLGGIPVYVYPQAEAGSATHRQLDITITGYATANATHTVVIAGREGLEGGRYDFAVVKGDSSNEISQKIEDAVNNVLDCPMTATGSGYDSSLTTKWKGLTAQEITVTVSTNDLAVGITYAVAEITAGSGTPAVTTALNLFGNAWNTIVVNTYGTVSSIMTELEDFNGIADPTTPTGRYTSTTMKPFIALTGSVANNPSDTTNARLTEMTIAICPAPLSPAHPLEAAANQAVNFATTSQDSPNSDTIEQKYSDMPAPADGDIGSMAVYANRDSFVKKGCSTVDIVDGEYIVKDFVTTYHPTGETPAQFAYCRNLMLDLNVFYGYYLKEQISVVGKTLIDGTVIVNAANTISTDVWKGILFKYADELGARALIADVQFMKDSLVVNIGTSNPDRMETFFRYKRTGTVRIASSTAEAGFNFG